MRWGHAAAVVFVVVGAAGGARAQPADGSTLVKHGLVLRRERRDAEALDEFRRAYAIDPAPRTLAQIALAEQALGKWVDAEADLQKAVGADHDPWIRSNRRDLDAGLAAIRGHLGSLEVAADVAGAELWVNGVRAGLLPLGAPLRVEAGSVVVEVRAAGYAAARRLTSVEPGGSAREDVHLVPLAPAGPLPETQPAPPARAVPLAVAPLAVAPPPAARTLAPGDRRLRYVSFALLGAGAAGLAVGTYFGVSTLTTKSTRDNHCQGQQCDAQGVALDGQARSLAARSTAWFAGGLLAAGVGVGCLLLSLNVGADRASAGLGGRW
jgi:hypothetical protein